MTKNVRDEIVPLAGKWWVYMLRCADDSLYTGITTDVLRRWGEHNGGPKGARYTRTRRPVLLVLCVPVPDRAAACRLEARLKALSRARKEQLIRAVFRPTVANGARTCLTARNLNAETIP